MTPEERAENYFKGKSFTESDRAEFIAQIEEARQQGQQEIYELSLIGRQKAYAEGFKEGKH